MRWRDILSFFFYILNFVEHSSLYFHIFTHHHHTVSETCSTTTTTPCSRLCMAPEGSCLSNGNCLCKEGFTGPNAKAHEGSTTQVEASHCLNTCGVKNEHQECIPSTGCDARCQKHLGHECITSGEFLEGK